MYDFSFPNHGKCKIHYLQCIMFDILKKCILVLWVHSIKRDIKLEGKYTVAVLSTRLESRDNQILNLCKNIHKFILNKVFIKSCVLVLKHNAWW